MPKIATNTPHDFSKQTLGTGSITENTGIFTLSTKANSDKAYLYRFIPTYAGTRIVARVTARCLEKPEKGKEMKLVIDNYKQGVVNEIIINSTNWQTYEIATTIPYNEAGVRHCKVVVGAWANQISKIEVSEFDIYAEDGGFPFPRVHAMGVIEITKDKVVSLSSKHASSGITNLVYNNNELKITTPSLKDIPDNKLLPVQNMYLISTERFPFSPRIINFNKDTGEVTAKLYNIMSSSFDEFNDYEIETSLFLHFLSLI